MQQRDIIKEEIEQLGRALGKLIANFLGLKTQGNVTESIQITNTELQSELDIDIDELVLLESKELEEFIESKCLVDLHLDQLSSYLFEIGLHEKSVDGDSNKWFRSAKRLLDIVREKSDTITFARIDLLERLERELL